MAGNVLELNDANFDETAAKCVLLVDFWAPWCGPCRMQAPIIEQVASETGDKARIAKMNVDDAPQTATRYGIRSIPTLIIFKDGQPAQTFVGVQQAADLLAAIKSALGAP